MGNQQEYLEKYKKESILQLNHEHHDMVNNFLNQNIGLPSSYMITIARDGETPARSIYYYNNVLDAVSGYNKYTDWGFAKEYLTVTLYGPGGLLEQKTLKRSLGGTQGDSTFIRQDYINAENIIKKYKNRMSEADYKELVKDFAILFSRDNIRFDVSRFFRECQCEEVFE